MRVRLTPRLIAFTLPTLLLPGAAMATNGYFSHGYGVQSLGQGGTGIALSTDALAPATNPANTGASGDRADLGLSLFLPRRSADIAGNAFGPDSHHDGDGRKVFAIPEAGVSQRLSPTLSWGLALYGNGGMNTEYASNPYGRFGAQGKAGVNLEQLFITPALAYRPSPGQALGLAVNLAVQRFSAQGIGLFDGFSAAPGHVSDQGTDTSVGAGLRLGWTGTLAPGFTAGVTWSQKIHGRFDKYRGLFADAGRFDVPENAGLGLAWAATPAVTLLADVQRIRYSRVAAVGDSAAALFSGTPLGAAGGPGFGWRDITVLKFGLQWRVQGDLTLRAGYSHAGQPVPASETFFNILAPGVVQSHLTAGATWALNPHGELSAYVALAPRNTVQGRQSIPPGAPPAGLGGGEASVRLKETLFGASYAWTW